MSDSEKSIFRYAGEEMNNSYVGYCPNKGKILVRDTPMPRRNQDEVRCPSCREHFHQMDQLDWRQR